MILYNKTAIRYGYSKNQHGVSSYDTEGVRFACNVQPLNAQEFISAGFDSSMVYKVYRMYCDYSSIVVGDKISIDGVTYIAKSIQRRDGTGRKFYKVIISESEGA